MLQELTEDNLNQHIANEQTTIVQYSAGWCGNCRMIKPKFKRMAAEQESAQFFIVDAEKYPNSRGLANVDNLPTFAAFRNGELIKQIQTNKADLLKDFIDEVTTD